MAAVAVHIATIRTTIIIDTNVTNNNSNNNKNSI